MVLINYFDVLSYCKLLGLGDHFATKFNTLGQTVLEIYGALTRHRANASQCDPATRRVTAQKKRNAVVGPTDRDADLCSQVSDAFVDFTFSKWASKF